MSHRFFLISWLSVQFILINSFLSFPQSLQVISISPSFNEIANDQHPVISVDFNIAIDSATFDNISFSIFGERSAYHSGELEFSNKNKTVTFNSDNDFNAGERVTINLSRKIQSQQGDSLKGFSWTFRIPAKQKELNFSEPVMYGGDDGGGGEGMQCLDMNNDGHPDIVTSSGVIFINDGLGQFPSYWYLDDAYEFYPIIVDDFNRDGDMDIIYNGTGGLTLGLGNSTGNFLKSYFSPWFYDYISSDINSDGYPDLIGINRRSLNPPFDDTTSFVAIAYNDGSGQFTDTVWIKQLTGIFKKIDHSDIENDGDADLIIISSVAPINVAGLEGLAVLRNNGGGVFDDTQLLPACNEFNITFPNYLYSSDFNNDGLSDIAVIADMGGGVTYNKGIGIFGECFDTTYTRRFWGSELPATFTGGDFDGDGWIDLAISGFGFPFESHWPKQYTVLENVNSYFFSDPTPIDTLGSSETLIFSNSGVDLNSDGYMDLVHSGKGVYVTLAIDITPSVEENSEFPIDFILYQNYPNPFNSQTEITFENNKVQKINISIYNILGEEVRLLENNLFLPGKHSVVWDGKDSYNGNLPSGVYLIRANFTGAFKTVKALLLK